MRVIMRVLAGRFMKRVDEIERGLSARGHSAEESQRSVGVVGFAQYFVIKIETGG